MSTRIDGWLISKPIAKAYDLLLAHKPAMACAQEEAMNTMIAQTIEGTIQRAIVDDLTHPGKIPIEHRKVRDLIWRTQTRAADSLKTSEKEGSRNPEFDFKSEVYLFPMASRTLLIVNTDSRMMREALTAPEWMQDHHWQDSTDKPEEVPAIIWRKRRKDWEQALPGAGRPADRCLVMEMNDGNILMHEASEDISTRFRPLDERIERAAKELYASRESMKSMEASKGNSADYLHGYISAIGRTADDPTIYETCIPEVAERLEDITMDTQVPQRADQETI